MSVTFTKLFSSITASTIWAAPDTTRILWVTMLAMADQRGRVWASIPGLANIARISIEACERGLEEFKSPDKYSRTKDNEGRRIEDIDGGWRLLNYAAHRAIRDSESIKESKRKYINARRAAERQSVEKSSTCCSTVDRSRHNTEAEVEEEQDLKDLAPSATLQVLVPAPSAQGPDEAVKKRKRSEVPPCPVAKIVDAYHRQCPTLNHVEVISDFRSSLVKSRWREVIAEEKFDGDAALQWFEEYFGFAASSQFLSGRAPVKNGSRPFKADFEWLMRPQNFVKVVEGKYA